MLNNTLPHNGKNTEQPQLLKQILILSRVQLKNLFGINEMRYTKDKKKKATFALLTVAYLLVLLMVVGYIGSMSFAFHYLGMGEIVPMYLYTILSLEKGQN